MQRIITAILLLIISGGTWFSSRYFYDEINDSKLYFVLVISLLFFYVAVYFLKDFSPFVRECVLNGSEQVYPSLDWHCLCMDYFNMLISFLHTLSFRLPGLLRIRQAMQRFNVPACSFRYTSVCTIKYHGR